MRHRVKGGKIGRNASHRLATLRALATSLFKYKKIKTTLAKAKAAKSFIEPLITKAKDDSVHAKRYIARHINDRSIVQELFNTIVPKIGDRPGGYSRVVKLGQRHGDASEMAILELVDFNDVVPKTKTSKTKTKKDKSANEVKEVEAISEETRDENIQDAEVIEETETKSEEDREEITKDTIESNVENKASEGEEEEKKEEDTEAKEDSDKESK